MVKSQGQISYRWGSGGLHEFCDHTLPFYMHIKGVVSFTCDQPWTGHSLTALALFILIKVVPALIIAIGVSWGIYNFLTHLAFTESTSTVTETWTDPDGTTHSKTETKTQQGPDYIALLIIGGLIIVGVLVVPELLRQRRGTAGRRKR